MIASILVALQAFEAGVWAGQYGWRRRQRERIRGWLVWGHKAPTSLPIIDGRLQRAAGVPTKTQARVATGVVKATRWLVHTQAFEHLVLKTVRDRWPGRRVSTEVTLHL